MNKKRQWARRPKPKKILGLMSTKSDIGVFGKPFSVSHYYSIRTVGACSSFFMLSKLPTFTGKKMSLLGNQSGRRSSYFTGFLK